MECFINKIFLKKVDDSAHKQFVRFSKGKFEGRAALSLQKGDKIKLGGSFEFASDFAEIVAEISDSKFSGIILSKEELDFPGKPKGIIKQYNIVDIESKKITEIKDKAYSMLLDAEGPGITLKMKKKLPKPGKSGTAKIDDKFCTIEADMKYWPQIKEAFMLPDCKKSKISHTYLIEEIVMPKGEKDFNKVREMSKRKGKIIRKSVIDGTEKSEERDFEA